jgi:hypothetical protein
MTSVFSSTLSFLAKSSRVVLVAAAFPLAALLLGGCATTKDVARAKETGTVGTVRVYPVTTDQAWEIARSILAQAGARNIREHRKEGYMAAFSTATWAQWGTVIGAWVEPLDRANTRVTSFTEQMLPITTKRTLTEAIFHQRFAQAVAALNGTPPPPATR